MDKIERKYSGRGDILDKFRDIIASDEHMLRLLYYNPLDKDGDYVDFTDENLPNILDKPELELEEIRENHIRKSQKLDKIVESKRTVIFIYYGKSKPVYRNHLLVKREVVFDILSHNDFSFDYRIEEICDRLDTLFSNKRVAGIGITMNSISFQIEAPKEYLAYRNKFIITDSAL